MILTPSCSEPYYLIGINYIAMFMSLRLAPLLKAMPFAMRPRPALTMQPTSAFSEYFDKQDTKDLTDLVMNKHRKNFLHYKLTDQWKKPLERKARRKERIAEIAAAKVEPAPELEKLVVHNQALGIEYPPKLHEQFAIIQVDGFQYKVLEDTILILDTKAEHEINKVVQNMLSRSPSTKFPCSEPALTLSSAALWSGVPMWRPSWSQSAIATR